MYLKALEIQGFKSFADKTVLSFGEAITAIVGPNGSGKSNLSDAIRWVMGEQSTKSLRGGKMEDVIFGGTAKRRAMGCAEVSLILDNSDGALPMEENEVMITRRYYRSGEGEYCINRRPCRLRDINDLFLDTGLGREGYSLIGQGRIDEILSTRSGDRRSVFEEAAGISRYRHRKEEAQRRLERTDENLLRIGDKISELELQLEPLAKQAEKAKKYIVLREELKGLEVSLWLDNLDQLRMRIRKLEMDCSAAAAQRSAAAAEQERLYRRSEEVAALMRQSDLELDELRTRSTQTDREVQQLESDLAVLETRIASNQENLERLALECQAQQDRSEAVAEEISQRRAEAESLAQREQALQSEQEQLRSQWEENRRQSDALRQELSRLQEQEAMQNASAAQLRSLLSALSASAEELTGRRARLEVRLTETRQQLDTCKEERRARRRALEELRERSQSLQNVLSGHQLRLKGREERLNAASEEVNRLTVEAGGLRSRAQMLREMEQLYEGYSKAVKTVMQAVERRQLKGVHGPLAGLIQPEPRCTVAIETALGGGMQNLVVDREEDGKAAIQYLKQRNAGRATFLPLSAIRPSVLREQGVEQCPGFVGIASALVRCEERYRDIVDNQLGRTVVAEQMDAAIAMARRYHHRFKIVTLDGQVLNAGGSMTGGSASRSAGILSRSAELEGLARRAEAVEEQLSARRKECESIRREVGAARYEMDAAQRERQELEAQISREEGQGGQLRVMMNRLNDDLDRDRDELEELEERAVALETQRAQARERLTALEGQAEAARTEAEGVARGQEQFRTRDEALSASLSEGRATLAALSAQREAADRALRELERRQADLSADRESREREMEDCRVRERELRGEARENAARKETLLEQKQELGRAIERCTAARMELERQRVQADQAARDKNTELLNLERECSVLEQKRSGAQMEEKQLIEKLWESYELTYDSAASLRRELDSPTRAGRQIADLKRRISALGAVNLGAIEDYQRLRERYDYLSAQRADVEHARQELEEIIRGITEEMKKLFEQEFLRINEAFSVTFQELFGGGSARLELDDPEDVLGCGIEIRVQPPGKALKVLSLLSGGEKAFVAIALYFAFLKVRPTPFVVMDEIEAALDDSNVERFADYLRRMTNNTQFIAITHRRGTMEEADVLYGVTMQERGVSRMLMLNLNEAEAAIQG